MFPISSFILPSVNDTVAEMGVKPLSEMNTNNSRDIECFFIYADPCIVIMKSSAKVSIDLARHL